MTTLITLGQTVAQRRQEAEARAQARSGSTASGVAEDHKRRGRLSGLACLRGDAPDHLVGGRHRHLQRWNNRH